MSDDYTTLKGKPNVTITSQTSRDFIRKVKATEFVADGTHVSVEYDTLAVSIGNKGVIIFLDDEKRQMIIDILKGDE